MSAGNPHSAWTHWVKGAITRGCRDACDFLFPPACVLCQRETSQSRAPLCEDCRHTICPPDQNYCLKCAAPAGPFLNTSHGCPYCRNESYAFRRVLALGHYDQQLRLAVLMGKEAHGAPVVMALTDALIDQHLTDFLTEPVEAVVPIPHHWGRRFWKIHSASETVGERLSSRLRRRYAPHILHKPRPTPLQTTAVPSVRRRQQRQAFEVPVGIDLTGARLLLVDDVMTTGATAQAATRTLLAAGAADVLVAVIARGIGQTGQVSR